MNTNNFVVQTIEHYNYLGVQGTTTPIVGVLNPLFAKGFVEICAVDRNPAQFNRRWLVVPAVNELREKELLRKEGYEIEDVRKL
jgi:hypothetical protein